MRHEDKTFDNDTIRIDGNTYVRCEFHDCTLIFSASGSFGFDSCSFDRCACAFSGAAKLTVQFMDAIYSAQGLGGGPIGSVQGEVGEGRLFGAGSVQ